MHARGVENSFLVRFQYFLRAAAMLLFLVHSREFAKSDSSTFGCLSVHVLVWNSWAAPDLFFVKFYIFF